ncbi:MAG: T9SS type A sorting domain-containing protein [Chitinophagaceae bacterium]
MTTQVSIYPNPFASSLSFEIIVENNEATIIRLLDQKQKIIKMISWHLKKGTNKTSFDNLQSLPNGNYFVDIKNLDGSNLFSTKIAKM